MKILIARNDAIGDLVLSTAIIKPLKQAYPQAKLYYLVNKSYADIISNIPEINGVISDPLPYSFSIKQLPQIYRFAKQIQAEKFDLFLGLWEAPKNAWLSFFANIPKRIGRSDYPINRLLYTHRIFMNPRDYTTHQVLNNLACLKPLNIAVDFPSLYLPKDSKQNELLFNRFPTLKKPYCCIHMGSGAITRRLTDAHFISIINYLNQKIGSVVLLGSEHEREHTQAIVTKINNPQIFNLVGHINLLELRSVIAESQLFVGADSGPIHIAAAYQTPSVGYYITRIQNCLKMGPWHAKHRMVITQSSCQKKCNPSECKDAVCRNELNLQELYSAIDAMCDQKQIAQFQTPQDWHRYWATKTLKIGIVGEPDIELKNYLQTHQIRYQILSPKAALKESARIVAQNDINILIVYRLWDRIKFEFVRTLASNFSQFYAKLIYAKNHQQILERLKANML